MAEFFNVGDALAHLTLDKKMTAAEFGCGFAPFGIALAEKLSQGKIYAMDIRQEALSFLQGHIAREKIRNIIPMLCDVEAKEGSGLPGHALDVVVIPNVLFQAENKHGILQEAHRVLKPGGQLLAVDWLKAAPSYPTMNRVTPQELKTMGELQGFSFKREFGLGDYHYGQLFSNI